MIACIDVAYVDLPTPAAFAACLVFDSWSSDSATAEYTTRINEVADYVPGQFYKRELPPILQVLSEVDEPVDTVIVDGYVQLSSDRPGLGQILFDRLSPNESNIVVVGVAKKHFAGNDVAIEVFRGGSKRPLYVTAAGMSILDAAEKVKKMHGEHRLPTLLKEVDGLVRQVANDANA